MNYGLTKFNKGIDIEIEVFFDMNDYNITMDMIKNRIEKMTLADFKFDEYEWIDIQNLESNIIQIFPFFVKNKLYINVNDIV